MVVVRGVVVVVVVVMVVVVVVVVVIVVQHPTATVAVVNSHRSTAERIGSKV